MPSGAAPGGRPGPPARTAARAGEASGVFFDAEAGDGRQPNQEGDEASAGGQQQPPLHDHGAAAKFGDGAEIPAPSISDGDGDGDGDGDSDDDDDDLSKDRVRRYTEAERSLSPLQALRLYPTAVAWCLVASTCVIMEGYDMILIGNFFAYPTFAAKYGQFVDAHGQPQLSAAWQAALSNASPVGCFVGTLLNGLAVDRLGHKRVLLAALGVLAATVALTFFATNAAMLLAGELLCGLPWGVFASSAPAYASELVPLSLRGYLTSYTNMCFIVGQLIAAGVLAALVHRTDQWAYRLPFALQWLWPLLILPALAFAPESPWHLVRQGRLKQAEAVLHRLQRRSRPPLVVARGEEEEAAAALAVPARLAGIVHTNALEQRLLPGTSYADCFRGTERRRTEIACVAFAAQVLAGSAFAYNATYFFQQVGLATDQTYKLNTGGTALALVGTLVNWFALLPYAGRRRIFLTGMATLAGLLLVVGLLGIGTARAPAWARGIGLTQAALTLVWTFVFQLSVGQLGWAIPAEIGSTRLRQKTVKTVCLARTAYYVAAVSANALQAYLLNPAQLNLSGYAAFVWAGTAAATWVWAFLRLPETRGRTYAELDWLFARRVPARQFAATRVKTAALAGLPGDGHHHHPPGILDGAGNEDEDAQEMDAMVHRAPAAEAARGAPGHGVLASSSLIGGRASRED
ncbi:alpha-glucoside:hydrogen symporter [Niveomyces insectorum RCEF 264]|uniref:Alpha-glucoside:hydrogen symporter n=1 Tax=Niveomyces insectorum RCEF 264 TaxID=1081102 RepID=A0A167S1G7_9HYPO|nr:alpha-glucoside:hydrogen symporter [Niveomyces insectorum RCEF 264]